MHLLPRQSASAGLDFSTTEAVSGFIATCQYLADHLVCSTYLISGPLAACPLLMAGV